MLYARRHADHYLAVFKSKIVGMQDVILPLQFLRLFFMATTQLKHLAQCFSSPKHVTICSGNPSSSVTVFFCVCCQIEERIGFSHLQSKERVREKLCVPFQYKAEDD